MHSDVQSTLSEKSPDEECGSVPNGFCPEGGLFGNSSSQYNHEVASLLSTRLRSATVLLLAMFVAFLLRNLMPHAWELPGGIEIMWFHGIVVAVLAGMAVLLFWRRGLSVFQLRSVEAAVFGLPAAFFVWMQVCRVTNCTDERAVAMAMAFPAMTVIPWILHIQLYGLFIPNTWKRATTVIAAMAVAPLIGALVAGMKSACVYNALLIDGGLSAMVLWITLASVVAVYGTHRFGLMRRQAFDARRIGSYTLREKLGSGGMGDVYIAEHRLLKRRCAIKLIKPDKADDANALARFESEVQAAARLTHQNTIEIYDYGHTRDGTFYYAMEFLPGLNLQEIVERFGPMPEGRVVHLLQQVCSALKESHGRGLIHRDVKPGNIFAAERGGVYDVAKLLDFGLVKSLQTDVESMKLTMDGAVVGSPLFAAPEATIDDKPGPGSDIYSLGATAYFLLTGQPVFPGDNPLKVLFAHVNESPRPLSELLPGVSHELEIIVMKCLEKKPEDRFTNVEELGIALANCANIAPWTESDASQWWSQTPVETDANPTGEPETDRGTAATAMMKVDA